MNWLAPVTAMVQTPLAPATPFTPEMTMVLPVAKPCGAAVVTWISDPEAATPEMAALFTVLAWFCEE